MRTLLSLMAVSASVGVVAQSIQLDPKPSGAAALVGYGPIRMSLSYLKPESVRTLPKGITSPQFGQLHVGGKSLDVIWSQTEGVVPKMYVDTLGTGDFSKIEPTELKPAAYRNDPKGPLLTRYMGSIKVSFGAFKDAVIPFYKFDKMDTGRKALGSTILYYPDYYMEGTLDLNGKKMRTLLVDRTGNGTFTGTPISKTSPSSGVQLFVDINGDGKFHPKAETFDAAKPFNIGGTSYILSLGSKVALKKSPMIVAEITVPPDQSVGAQVIAFNVKATDGTPISFPSTFKGKIVMLDFWATWCGPCKGEIPGLVKTYNAYKDKGFDVLGISLDQENMLEKLGEFTKEWNMPWKQVYDGKYWAAAIAEKFGIQAIPASYLVDGDTGRILAVNNSLRGELLAPTIEKALATKAGGGVNSGR